MKRQFKYVVFIIHHNFILSNISIRKKNIQLSGTKRQYLSLYVETLNVRINDNVQFGPFQEIKDNISRHKDFACCLCPDPNFKPLTV